MVGNGLKIVGKHNKNNEKTMKNNENTYFLFICCCSSLCFCLCFRNYSLNRLPQQKFLTVSTHDIICWKRNRELLRILLFCIRLGVLVDFGRHFCRMIRVFGEIWGGFCTNVRSKCWGRLCLIHFLMFNVFFHTILGKTHLKKTLSIYILNLFVSGQLEGNFRDGMSGTCSRNCRNALGKFMDFF